MLQEAKNKAWVMELVNNVDTMLVHSAESQPLGMLLDACYQMGSYPALWAVEGLGFYHAEMLHRQGLSLQNVLTSPETATFPDNSLCMLHAGIGLSFARRSFEGLRDRSSTEDLRRALHRFIYLCRNAARNGYLGCSLESLGLPTLILHGPKMALRLHDLLAETEPLVASYMWRGVGRALYFYPANFIPGRVTQWKGFAMADRLAPSEDARKNMHAGMAWAITLVNMQHPEIMETLLRARGETGLDREPFVNGVVSSMIMRYDITPENPSIFGFIRHQPSGDSLVAQLWARDIRDPCEQAISEIYPVLRQAQALEEIFRYQSLLDLADRRRARF